MIWKEGWGSAVVDLAESANIIKRRLGRIDIMSCTVLTLISSSTTRKEPTDYDLKFPVDVTQLPKFSVTDIWKNAISNPLRDR